MMNGIEVKNVCKRFGSVTALEDVTLTFEPKKYTVCWDGTAPESPRCSILLQIEFLQTAAKSWWTARRHGKMMPRCKRYI